MRFTWHLPCSATPCSLRAIRTNPMSTTKKNVLVIDDDSKVRQSLGRALTTENYGVVSAANGREAMRHFDENRIDVVLLDLNLGPESGWDIFENLAALQPMHP